MSPFSVFPPFAAVRAATAALFVACSVGAVQAQTTGTTNPSGQPAKIQNHNVITTTVKVPTTQTPSIPGEPRIQVNPEALNARSLDVNAPRSGPVCGGVINGKPQSPCPPKPAIFQADAVSACPAGTFFDAIGGGQCWSCPAGYSRTAETVAGERACAMPDKGTSGQFLPAKFLGGVCPAGSFYDPIRGGECWSCPAGYKRSAAHVEAANACFIAAGEKLARANRHQKTIWPHDCKDGRFHDIWDGGNCWSCPAGFRRTGHHINDAGACVQGVAEQQARATVTRKGSCNAGEIHDPRNGGECWVCPEATTRTIFPVHEGRACERWAGYKYSKATMATARICPADQFFDPADSVHAEVAARLRKQNTGSMPPKSGGKGVGTCWTCPPGYKRALNPVWSDGACDAGLIDWQTAPYPEPGLFALAGADAALQDIVRRHPALVKDALDAAAKATAKESKMPLAVAWQQERQKLVGNPQQSAAASALLLVRVLAVAAEPKKASAAEKQLLASFARYIQARRTYVAEDALAAYDAWDAANTYYKGRRASQGPASMGMLLDYGTVPPDFSALSVFGVVGSSAAAAAVGVATSSIPVVGDVVGAALGAAGNGFADFANPQAAVTWGARTAVETAIGKAAEAAVQRLAKATADKLVQQMIARGAVLGAQRAGQSVLAVAGSAGPQLIIGASMMIASIAIDQVIEIQNARPKLLTSIATAKQPADVARMAATADGVAEIMTMWANAVSGASRPTPDLQRALAAMRAP